MFTTKPTSLIAWARVRCVAHRSHYGRTTLHAILNEAYVYHIVSADGHGVHCIPTARRREGDHLCIHGSNGNHALRLVGSDTRVCMTVTHPNSLVLARSALGHSVNYRSTIIYGAFEIVPDARESAMFDTFMKVLALGRSRQARPGNTKELVAMTVLRIPLGEAACKVRTSGPKDNAEDLELSVWTGVLPMMLLPLPPVVQAVPAGTFDYVWEWRDNARVPVGDVVML